ncbi:DUF7568 family protein [Halorussus salilacus]
MPNWTRFSRVPSLEYQNMVTGVRAIRHRPPDSYVHKWHASILIDG